MRMVPVVSDCQAGCSAVRDCERPEFRYRTIRFCIWKDLFLADARTRAIRCGSGQDRYGSENCVGRGYQDECSESASCIGSLVCSGSWEAGDPQFLRFDMCNLTFA